MKDWEESRNLPLFWCLVCTQGFLQVAAYAENLHSKFPLAAMRIVLLYLHTIVLCVYVCVFYVYRNVCVCVFVYAHACQDLMSVLSVVPQALFMLFLRQGPFLAWSWASGLGWLVRGSQGSFPLHQPSTGMPNTFHKVCICHMGFGAILRFLCI